MREYVPMPGRLGDVVDLFHTVVIPLFDKHEMEISQMGCTSLGDNSYNEFVYTMRFANLAELERKWGAFLADPQWASALADREASRPLYQTIRRRIIDSSLFDQVLDASK
ncbi:NIPSNAP family protein [Pseudarthrobacter enclensis]|uniref:NIPSNAP domain-containing protein n=1 Tax=Pseudarthrobacter enclensis TaxID=993070 RepID=A0ABT9RTT7_9MICC|nr:NIPSNAP family protein [Pseudarthrobacter enclensis]MDP9888661.1 hypothetical protein [Pseudarthrobacter enclensis]